MAVERVLSNLNLISFKTEGGLQNHIDELQDGDLVFTPDNSLKGNLFDFKWTDHKLNDMSWLNADTFSWQSGDVYVAAYEHLVADFDGTTAETDTVDDITVTFYRAEDGHKICLADQEANVQRLYDWMGVAWYYVLDTANKQFKLPRTKYAFTGLRDSVGGYVPAGLPNITGEAGYYLANVGSLGVNIANGAFAKTGSEKLPTATKTGTESTAVNTRFNFNASRSSSVYGNSNTVQPEATQMYLYFYVGNFERDAVEQTAGITSEQLNNKLDKSAETYLVPSGAVSAFAGTTAPTGWLKCDGSAISRTTYSALFDVIGTTYGAGDGSATFNLPTQSVLPLGLTAPIVYNSSASKNAQVVRDTATNNAVSSWQPGGQYSSGIVSKDGLLQNETNDNVFTKVNIDLNGTHYANIANATGAKAIVCIKY